jgi:uncharacterized protein
MSDITPTPRTKVRRVSERASYDQAAIYAALDEAPFATIAFNAEGSVHAIPTAAWREENHLYIHGSNGSRLLKTLQMGAQACVVVANMHGLILARSAVKHSMNYSSVCIYGIFEPVAEASKNSHMQRFMEHWLPGRWQYVRQPDQKELAATTILRIPIVEAVLKTRQGPPTDYEEDMGLAVWAGIAPLHLQWQTPEQVEEQEKSNLPGLCLRNGMPGYKNCS